VDAVKNMKYSIILIFAIVLFELPGNCQTKAKITDVDYYLEGNYIVVNYTIIGSLPKEHMTIELSFKTEDNKLIIPQTISGDIGNNHYGDGMKTIHWDIVRDHLLLSGNLKAIVTITSSKILYGGPSNALLSVVIPGLGGYFDEKNKSRSILTTISTLGFLGYGIAQKHLANKYYNEYKASILTTEIENLYNKANNAQHKYYISTRVATGLWAFDIIWVALKGIKNKKVSSSYYGRFNKDDLKLNYVNNSLQLQYSVSF
jgi:hypothetical protein